ncbi:unnamed protein product, partial [Hymenolepis diminuta]|uniref:Uncharacterized protein n=1 Tax=Hymenolepis diminuta TaxID=6216 RepID=A0A0R3SNH2_HYMDI
MLFGKKSLLFVILLCLAFGTSLAYNHRRPRHFYHGDGDGDKNLNGLHKLSDDDDREDDDDDDDDEDDDDDDEDDDDDDDDDDSDHDDHDGYVHFPPNIHAEDWSRMTWHIRAHVALAIFESIPNIPVELINLIVYKDLEFLEFIVKKHDNIEGLVRHMDPPTLQHFCQNVPSFGIIVGQLDPEVLETLIVIHPTLD